MHQKGDRRQGSTLEGFACAALPVAQSKDLFLRPAALHVHKNQVLNPSILAGALSPATCHLPPSHIAAHLYPSPLPACLRPEQPRKPPERAGNPEGSSCIPLLCPSNPHASSRSSSSALRPVTPVRHTSARHCTHIAPFHSTPPIHCARVSAAFGACLCCTALSAQQNPPV